MQGRPKQPIQQLISSGKSHLTKQQIADRKNAEELLRGGASIPRPPKMLSTAERKQWTAIAKQLAGLELFHTLDVDSLTRYVQAQTIYQQSTDALGTLEPLDPMYHKLVG